MDTKTLSTKELSALHHIQNALMGLGRMPSVRELMVVMNYQSPRSAALIFESLAEKGILVKKSDGRYQFNEAQLEINNTESTVAVPLLGTVACGSPIFAEENIEAYYRISTKLAPASKKHFFLRAVGDSMDLKGINEGDLVLVREQPSAKNGDIVVALIDDRATIKEFQSAGGIIVLKPHSTNPAHNPIILHEDFQIQGVVVTTVPNL